MVTFDKYLKTLKDLHSDKAITLIFTTYLSRGNEAFGQIFELSEKQAIEWRAKMTEALKGINEQ